MRCPGFVEAAQGLPDSGEWRTHPAVADINKDGLDDIAAIARKDTGPRIFLSDGLGHWTEASAGLPYREGFACGVGTRLSDLNGDGQLDLVAADHCTGLWVYFGDGGTSWKEYSPGIPRNVEGFNDADVGDIDRDGSLDIVAISAFDGGMLVLHGQPSGIWTPTPDTGLPTTGSGWQIKLLDIDQSGTLDVVSTFNPVTSNQRVGPFPPAKVWLQDTQGKFHPATGFSEEGRWFGVAPVQRAGGPPYLFFGVYGAHAGLYQFESDTGELWRNLGRIDEPWYPGRIIGYAGIAATDVNGDRCEDLLLSESATRVVWLALGDCENRWHLCPENTIPKGSSKGQNWGLATGDVNGDGLLDIVAAFGTNGKGNLKAWVQTGPPAADDSSTAQGQATIPSRAAGP